MSAIKVALSLTFVSILTSQSYGNHLNDLQKDDIYGKNGRSSIKVNTYKANRLKELDAKTFVSHDDLAISNFSAQLFKLSMTKDSAKRELIQQKLELTITRSKALINLIELPNKYQQLRQISDYIAKYQLPQSAIAPVIIEFLGYIKANNLWDHNEHKFSILPFLHDQYIDSQLFNKSHLKDYQPINQLVQSLDQSTMPKILFDYFQVVLTNYFGEIDRPYQSRYIVELIWSRFIPDPELQNRSLDLEEIKFEELYKKVTWIDSIGILLQNSGPALQKLFQLMAPYIQEKDLRKEIDKLKENVKPFPNSLAQKIVNEIFQDVVLENPIGQATVGQVYLTKLSSSDPIYSEKKIIKVKRPGIDSFSKIEMDLLKQFALTEYFKDSAIGSVVEDLENNLYDELNFQNEFDNLEFSYLNYIYRDMGKGLFSAKIRRLKREQATDLIVMDVAPGKSMDHFLAEYNYLLEYAKEHPHFLDNADSTAFQPHFERQTCDDVLQLTQRYRLLIDKWLKNGLFGSGHIHADAHPGNVFYEYLDLESFFKSIKDYNLAQALIPIQKRAEIKIPRLTLIDFGSMPKIKLEEREALINLIISLGIFKENPQNKKKVQQLYNNMKLIVRNEKQVEKMNRPEIRAQIIESLKSIDSKDQSPGKLFKEVLQILLKNNIDYSSGLTQFSRGHTMLEQTYLAIDKIRQGILKLYLPGIDDRPRYYYSSVKTCKELKDLEDWDLTRAWKHTLREGLQVHGQVSSTFKDLMKAINKQQLPHLNIQSNPEGGQNIVMKKLLKRMETQSVINNRQ